MSILTDLLARVQGVNEGLRTGELVRDALFSRSADVMEMQQRQLLAGKRPDGSDIAPAYSEDLKPSGYFHSVESAGRYAAWKQTLSYPYSVQRNADSPNLYINGKFYDELAVDFGTDAVGIIATTAYASGIMAKYANAFGLSSENWNTVFSERGALEDLMNELKSRLYG